MKAKWVLLVVFVAACGGQGTQTGPDGPGDPYDWFCGDVFYFFVSQQGDLGREVVVLTTVTEVVKKASNELATGVLVLEVEEVVGDTTVADRICVCRESDRDNSKNDALDGLETGDRIVAVVRRNPADNWTPCGRAKGRDCVVMQQAILPWFTDLGDGVLRYVHADLSQANAAECPFEDGLLGGECAFPLTWEDLDRALTEDLAFSPEAVDDGTFNGNTWYRDCRELVMGE